MRNFIFIISFFIYIQTNIYSKNIDNIINQQLIIVLAKNWNTNDAILVRYELIDNKWKKIGNTFEVKIGKNGMAWGIGLHSIANKKNLKKEGDNRSPAGIFKLGYFFSKNKKILDKINFKKILLSERIEAIDDPNSKYYNKIIDISLVKKDWRTSEKMFYIDLYEMGIEIYHNNPVQNKNAGSCIFIHKWRSPESGTAGCTSMSKEDLNILFFWLDADRNPLIIQTIYDEYNNLKSQFNLPDIYK